MKSCYRFFKIRVKKENFLYSYSKQKFVSNKEFLAIFSQKRRFELNFLLFYFYFLIFGKFSIKKSFMRLSMSMSNGKNILSNLKNINGKIVNHIIHCFQIFKKKKYKKIKKENFLRAGKILNFRGQRVKNISYQIIFNQHKSFKFREILSNDNFFFHLKELFSRCQNNFLFFIKKKKYWLN